MALQLLAGLHFPIQPCLSLFSSLIGPQHLHLPWTDPLIFRTERFPCQPLQAPPAPFCPRAVLCCRLRSVSYLLSPPHSGERSHFCLSGSWVLWETNLYFLLGRLEGSVEETSRRIKGWCGGELDIDGKDERSKCFKELGRKVRQALSHTAPLRLSQPGCPLCAWDPKCPGCA